MICKGRACALHLTKEYVEGFQAKTDKNPYDFFDQYEEHYAWCIGYQERPTFPPKRVVRIPPNMLEEAHEQGKVLYKSIIKGALAER